MSEHDANEKKKEHARVVEKENKDAPVLFKTHWLADENSQVGENGAQFRMNIVHTQERAKVQFTQPSRACKVRTVRVAYHEE